MILVVVEVVAIRSRFRLRSVPKGGARPAARSMCMRLSDLFRVRVGLFHRDNGQGKRRDRVLNRIGNNRWNGLALDHAARPLLPTLLGLFFEFSFSGGSSSSIHSGVLSSGLNKTRRVGWYSGT